MNQLIRYEFFDSKNNILFSNFFNTLDTKLQIITFGDSGNLSKEQLQVSQLANSLTSSLFIHLGDLAYPKSNPENLISHFLSYYGHLSPCLTTLGNHDIFPLVNGKLGCFPFFNLQFLNISKGRNSYRLFYTFKTPFAKFFFLDSNFPYSNEERKELLKKLNNEFKETDNIFKIIIFHHPMVSLSRKKSKEIKKGNLSWMRNYFLKNKVHLVLTGHQHNYQKWNILDDENSNNFIQIVAGTGGGTVLVQDTPNTTFIDSNKYHLENLHFANGLGYIEITNDLLIYQQIGLDNNILDQFSIPLK